MLRIVRAGIGLALTLGLAGCGLLSNAPAGATPAATSSPVAAASCRLTEADLPRMPGTIWEADQYTGVAGPSTIAPNGPWDFTTVAGTPSPLKQTIVDRQRAANAEVFPNATYVMQNEPAGAGEVPNRYRYLEIRPDGLYWLGDSNGAEPFKPEAPQRLLALPAHPGERWETAYTDDRFGRVRIASRYEIAGCGPLTTPLGTFERAVLVKTEVTIAETRSAATVYTWHVPGVGQVVTISNSALAPDSAAIVVVKRFQRP